MAQSRFQQIVAAMQQFIQGKNPQISTQEGTIVRDIVIEAPAQQIAQYRDDLDTVVLDQSPDSASDAGMDLLAQNSGLLRKSAVAAQGSVIFFTWTPPTKDITIPAGTVVSTRPSNASSGIQFVTTTTVTMYATLSSTYYNTTTKAYEIAVPIQAVNAGSKGNVGANTISSLIAPIIGIDGVYNSAPTVGGAEAESTQQLRARIAAKRLGTALDTLDGLTTFVSTDDRVISTYIVGNGQSPRDYYGAVDIYVQGSTLTTVTDVVPVFTNPYYFKSQPVVDIVSVISSVSGTLPNSSYQLNRDQAAYAGSVMGLDSITFSTGNLGSLFVTYQYNSLISDLQNNLNQLQLQNCSVLVHAAVEVLIDITVSIRIASGFDQSSVIGAVQTALSNYISSLTIGTVVKQSALEETILNTAGVTDCKTPFDVFKSDDGTILPDSFNNLNLPPMAYPVANTITVNVVV